MGCDSKTGSVRTMVRIRSEDYHSNRGFTNTEKNPGFWVLEFFKRGFSFCFFPRELCKSQWHI